MWLNLISNKLTNSCVGNIADYCKHAYSSQYFHRTMLPLLLSSVICVIALTPLSLQAANTGVNTISGQVTIRSDSGDIKADASSVVIYIEDTNKLLPQAASLPSAEIAQVNQQFQPVVLPIVVGSTVRFPNRDVVFHNVFSRSTVQPFDLGMYKTGEEKSLTFDSTGLIKVFCNIHPNMVAYILILDNQHFSTTDSKGNYQLTNLPNGNFTLVAWQRFGSEKRQEITLSGNSQASANAPINFELTETDTSVKHKNKFNKNYSNKY